MQEEFLWHIWKFRLFDNKELQTTSGEEIKILKVGEHNIDSGPDFFNARIIIDGTEWAGNVEVHINSSDWHKHKHSADKAYDNVILHVVHQADEKLFRKSGGEIPTLELKNKIPQNIYGKYLRFKSSRDWIPCGKQIQTVNEFTLHHWLERLMVERLEKKTASINELLQRNHNNWEEIFYQRLAYGFGLKVNAQPFEQLAQLLPLNLLAKQKDNLVQLEALLFGQAGLLEKEFKDEYPKRLQKEYAYLKQKFKLKSMDGSAWKFMRLHPPSFPTIRIAQFANLVYKSLHLFSKCVEAVNIYTIRSLLHAEASPYWNTHYLFDKESSVRRKTLGDETKDILIINIVVPLLFAYGKQKGNQELTERALDFLHKTNSEHNSILEKWKSLGISVGNAQHSQALLQLKNEYCSNKRCLECGIGNALLK